MSSDSQKFDLEHDAQWQAFIDEVDTEQGMDLPVMNLDQFAVQHTFAMSENALEHEREIASALAHNPDVARAYLLEEQVVRLYGRTTPRLPARVGDLVSTTVMPGFFEVQSRHNDELIIQSLDTSDNIVALDEQLQVERRKPESLLSGEQIVLRMDPNAYVVQSPHTLVRGREYEMLIQPTSMATGFPQAVGEPRIVKGQLRDFAPYAGYDESSGRLIVDVKTPDGELITGGLPRPLGKKWEKSFYAVEIRPPDDMTVRPIALSALRPGDVLVDPITTPRGSIPRGSFIALDADLQPELDFWDSQDRHPRPSLNDVVVPSSGFIQGREVSGRDLYKCGIKLDRVRATDIRVGDRLTQEALISHSHPDARVVIVENTTVGATQHITFQNAHDYGAPFESVQIPATEEIAVLGRREAALTEFELRTIKHSVRVLSLADLSPGLSNIAVCGTTEQAREPRVFIGSIDSVQSNGRTMHLRTASGHETVHVQGDTALWYPKAPQDAPDRSGGVATQYMSTLARFAARKDRTTVPPASVTQPPPPLFTSLA